MTSLSPASVKPRTKGARQCASLSTFLAALFNSAVDRSTEPGVPPVHVPGACTSEFRFDACQLL